jgi:hypothetical protein
MADEEKLKRLNYQSCFATDAGKKVLADLSGYCYEERNTFAEGNHDKQNVNNGKRAVILYIRDKMKIQTESKQATAIKE